MRRNLFCLFSLLLFHSSFDGRIPSSDMKSSQDVSTAEMITGDSMAQLGNNIMIIFQDSKDSYWFGSWETGLYKYDGKTILHYTTKNGLPHSRVEDIQEDQKGYIFLNTPAGVCKLNGETFTVLKPQPNGEWKLQPNDLWFKQLGRNGAKGLYRYDGKDLFQLEFPKHYMEEEYFASFPNNAWSPYDVYYMYKDNKGVMWFGTSNFGVCRFDGISHSWLYEDHLTNVPNGGSFGIRSILEDVKGQYWICNTRYRFNISLDSITGDGKVLIPY